MKRILLSAVVLAVFLCACSNLPFISAGGQTQPSPEQSAQSEPARTPAETGTAQPADSEFVLVVETAQPTAEPMPVTDAPEAEASQPGASETESAEIQLPDLGVTVRYKDQETGIRNMLYENGRLYISRSQLETVLGKAANGTENYLPEVQGCICLADVAMQYDLSISITAANSYVDLYDRKSIEQVGTTGDKAAYLRLEDIAADGLNADGSCREDANYTDYNLEKLRSIGEYLYSRGQQFYIAWIPVYVNPALGVENNIIEDQCLYNADFIYSLDYLRIHGGYIVLHGYTHQQFDTESAVGNEFGGDSEYTVAEMGERMDKAAQMAETLGYEHDIFEFPHYALTADSRVLAEERFDVIYQYGPQVTAQIEHTQRDGKTVTYIPTPPDYVYSPYDEDIFSRLSYADANGQLMSLFFHPTIDFHYMGMKTENGVRFWTMDNENAFLPRIIDDIEAMGYGFTHYEG